MASALVILLQLLLVSLVSASHNFGGSANYRLKGRDPNGNYRVEMRTKDTFQGCWSSHYWQCYSGHCGSQITRQTGKIDNSTNSPKSTRQWCETETVLTRSLSSDKPFIMRVPQNCYRRYELMAFDPDGDQVRCRYGTQRSVECSKCDRPAGFNVDENSCTLSYHYARQDTRAFAFEMVVEDFPQRAIHLTYSDRSQISKIPFIMRRDKRSIQIQSSTYGQQLTPNTHWSWWQQRTTTPNTTWSWWQQRTTTPNTTWSWWQQRTSTPNTTWSWWQQRTSTPNTTWYWWQQRNNTTTSRTRIATSTASTPSQTMMPTRRNQFATPLSKLPLQFSFLVDPPVASCQEGVFLPKLLPPTPANKAVIEAEVNDELRITVKGEANSSLINDVLMTGPMNITSSRASGDTFVIKWTPTPNEGGEFHPICFAIESIFGSHVYQSEMRCVLVKVVHNQVQTTVECTETTMIVTVDKSTFSRLDDDHLRLNDAKNTACKLTSNSTHVIANIPLNACGTEIREDADNLYFLNEITTVDNLRDVVTRKHLLEVQFFCQYPKRQNMTLAFDIHRDNITVMEKGFGTFTYGFEFYTNSQFQIMEDPRSYPLEYDIGSRIYMQIEATTSVNNTELFVESCSATPYDIPNYTPKYTIIERGCNIDPTAITHPQSHPREFRFSIEAFKFIGMHDKVYISCEVMMCKAGDPNTRCSRGCLNSTTNGNPMRRRREAVSQSTRHFISQGPLRLRRSTESGALPVLNLNLVFISGCVLAALAMISAVVVYKTKKSGLGYHPLPTQEGDAVQ